MKKIILIILILSFIGCKNENYIAEKKVIQIPIEVKSNIKKYKIYVEDIKIKEEETFFIEDSAMMDVIETGLEKGKIEIDSKIFKFDIDYNQLRKIGNKCNKKYNINDMQVLKQSLKDSIIENGIGEVTLIKDEADYSISLLINSSIIIYEGVLSTKGVIGYNFEIYNIKNDSRYLKERGFIFENLKRPLKNSINSIIGEDIISSYCSLNSETLINNNFEQKYGDIKIYLNFIAAVRNFKVVRLLSKIEGDVMYKYQCHMDWYRFFYVKK
jgi:hypothetical protein